MNSKNITNILLTLSVSLILFGGGYKLGEYRAVQGKVDRPTYSITNAQNTGKERNLDFSLFWQAWDEVEKKYVDKKKIDPQKMFYGAIKGMVASLEDPYTFFLTPQENKASQDDLGGKFEGIGAQLGLKENRIVIISPLKNSPAEEAGIKAGDVVAEVDGVSVKGWTLTQTVTKIRGEKGTKVKLKLLRGDKELDFEVTRDVINVSSVELSYEKGNIAYLKLNQFGTNTNDEWDRAVDEIVSRRDNGQVKGMVLDLRGNPGGYLESSVYLAGEFLKRGDMVVKQESGTNSVESREYRVNRNGKLLDIPLVVLIDRGSASASEILSGALRDHKRAKLVGEKSFGKGSVQEALNLKDNAGLHVTVAKWILPGGEWINGKGIEPQIKVENKTDEANTLTKDTDAQLQKAFETLGQE